VPVILVANKADLVDHDDSEFIIKLNTLNDIVVKYNFDRWIMTSARTGENVDQLIESLAKHAAELKPLMSENAGTRSQVILQLESSKSKDSKRIRKRDVIAQNCCKN
jgi:50S ribosomal subunit-associated GTPase HflX